MARKIFSINTISRIFLQKFTVPQSWHEKKAVKQTAIE